MNLDYSSYRDIPNLVVLHAGYRLVDTAALYRNEKSVGEAIRDSGIPREDVWVTTKLWDSLRLSMFGQCGYEQTLKACGQSVQQLGDLAAWTLGFLGTGYIDLYLQLGRRFREVKGGHVDFCNFRIHSPNTGKLVETWDAMIELQRRGLVKSIGVSRLHRIPMVGVPTVSPMLRDAEHWRNFGVPHLEALRDSGRQMPVVNQIVTGLQRFRFCAAHGIKITAYGSIFSGQQEQLARKEVASVLAAHPSKTAAQVLLRWGLQMDFQVIPKSVRQERLQENMNLMDFELTPSEMEVLSAMRGALHEYWNPLKSKVDLGRTDRGQA
ncbi:unnamed protein product [Symbiodinium pilosum]|uniref:NADP-dependent oxidoreductase domain-containing protein n=1 Tax=Symbiodinium pilosum TaxID=2952 RepID=A0A812QBV7_SYMPI|nr:unnamed protein product [Symbiodinium pilosum]